jgi:predicted CoA-binding protein
MFLFSRKHAAKSQAADGYDQALRALFRLGQNVPIGNVQFRSSDICVNLIGMNWQDNLITDTARIRELIAGTKAIAVLGIKTEAQAGLPAFYVPQYLHSAGFEVIPVPVYYPGVLTILGQKVYRRLVDIPDEVDLVNVFRRPWDVPAHLEDMLAKKPTSVWLQSGITHDAVAETLAKAGIKVVQDRCLMVDHRYLCGQR